MFSQSGRLITPSRRSQSISLRTWTLSFASRNGPRLFTERGIVVPDAIAEAGISRDRSTIMTASELQNLLVATLTRNIGGSRRQWRLAIGPIHVYNLETHPHCNWSVSPSGSIGENAAVEDLVDAIRSNHPIVVAAE